MDAFMKSLNTRNLRWKLYDAIREKQVDKTERDIVTMCVEVLDNSMSFLLSSKLVTDEWKGILGEDGILNTLDKKIEMAVALGLLSKHNTRLLQQIGDIQRVFELSDKEDLSFEDEPVRVFCERLFLPENTYITRKLLDMTERNVVIQWNPMERAKNARARFMFAFEYLYFDLENRSTYFAGEAPGTVEEVTLSMVLARQEARYQAFLNDIQQERENNELEWKIAKNMDKLLEDLLEIPPTTPDWNRIQKKREDSEERVEELQVRMRQLTDLLTETNWTWEAHKDNFSYLAERVEKELTKRKEQEAYTTLKV